MIRTLPATQDAAPERHKKNQKVCKLSDSSLMGFIDCYKLTDSKERATMSEQFYKQHTEKGAKSMDKATMIQAPTVRMLYTSLYVRQ